jgi:hypothetical protein
MLNFAFSPRSMPHVVSHLFRGAVASLLVCAAGGVSAAVITTNEAALDSIFSQTSFGLQSIDIRFTASQTIYDTALLSIDSDTEWTQLALFGGNSAYPVINMFFVDAMTWCGGPASNTIGCANTPGNMLMLNSDWAASANGGALAAHELAHNLGLDHVTGANTNLMNPILSGNTTLTTNQALAFLGDGTREYPGKSLIQMSTAGQRYITITPILIAASIPEPETWAMMVAGLLGMAGWVRRRKTRLAA